MEQSACGRISKFRMLIMGFILALALMLAVGQVGPVQADGGNCTVSGAQVTCTFGYTGGAQTWTVPAGVTQATFAVYGAAGGSASQDTFYGYNDLGGQGGEATATLDLTPGEPITLMVGGQGGNNIVCILNTAGSGGGFNGGGAGGSSACAGAGGGGASDVRIGGTDLAHRALVAGGGGASQFVNSPCGFPVCQSGGAGGGLAGGNGMNGGAGGGQASDTGSGQLGQGGTGADGCAGCLPAVSAGGGGGGGYYGGAGGPQYGGGGGGSGYGPAGVVFQSGVESGNGQIIITYTAPPPNAPPTVTANQASVAVNEGQTATNTGTVADTDGDTVTLSASTGSVTNNGDGTWSWSYATNDGPAQSQTVTITADDGQGGTTQTTFALTVNNVAPTITAVSGPSGPQAIGTLVSLSGAFTDPGTLDTHTATWDWGDGNTSAGTVSETHGSGTVNDDHAYSTAGVYTVTLTVTDKDGGVGSNTFQYVVVYDPAAGFVTGAGWIASPAGACLLTADCGTATGKATFGFVSRYQKGANVPTGNTEFAFQAGNLDFQSTSYQWLIVNQAGTNAQFKGTGTINGTGSYTFMIWATDGSPDTFRIQITDNNNAGATVYDNGVQQAIGGGSIVIHS